MILKIGHINTILYHTIQYNLKWNNHIELRFSNKIIMVVSYKRLMSCLGELCNL